MDASGLNTVPRDSCSRSSQFTLLSLHPARDVKRVDQMLTAQATALIPTAVGVPLLRSYSELKAAMRADLDDFFVKQKACMETYPVTSADAVGDSKRGGERVRD